jgi:hypothetical protein
MTKRHAVTTGRIGELYAAAALEELGWQTAFCQQAGVDLICWKDEDFYRVQVKASTYHNYALDKLQFHFGLGGKKRPPTPADYDLAALVSIPQRRVFFLPIFRIKQITLSRKSGFFSASDLEERSLNHALHTLREHGK